MKKEKEVIYLLKLVSSKFKKPNVFAKILISDISGSKSDFARICGVGEKKYFFRQWLNKLIKEGVLEENGISGKYLVNGNQAMKKIKEIVGEKAFKLIYEFQFQGFI